FTNPLLDLIRIPADTREEAYIYMVILMAGLMGMLGYNANAGILQGVGDARTPLLFLVIAALINVVLDLFFVAVIPLGVAGVAIATIIAQFFSWIFGIFYINKKYPELRIRPFSFRFDKRIFWQIIRLGLPAGIQQALFSFATILMTRLVNTYGSIYAAGFSVANKLDTFAFFPIQSIATAITTYTGQNIGARKLQRVNGGIRAALLYSMCFAVLGLLVIPAGPALLRLFTSEAAVVTAGMAFINRIMPFYWMLAISFSLNSVMRGAGEAIVPMASAVVGLWLARLPAAYLLAHFFGRDNMHFCYPAGWAIGLLITVPYFLSGRWKNKGLTQAGNNAPPQ
ncbi:MAG: MATE family efflux transporter, partial [Oscillospiraceae bacterium]